MNYKIPFGGCSCGCGTSSTTAGAGNGVAVVGNQARTYKLLTNEDKSISLQENMVAELDFAKVTKIDYHDIEMEGDLAESAYSINDRTSYFLKDTTVGGNGFGICFGAFPYMDYQGTYKGGLPKSNWDAEFGISSEDFLHTISGCHALEYWRMLANYCEEKYGNEVTKDWYGLLRLRTNVNTLHTYSLAQYLCDFPDMMNLDEVLWYLSLLFNAGFIRKNQNILVPLTDRMHLSGADYRSEDTYLYVAVFNIDSTGNISYRATDGFYTYGDSMNSLLYVHINNMSERIFPAFVFCQKRRDTASLHRIPLTVPVDFNQGGKATIMLRNTTYGYLDFQAVGKTFMPYRGDDLIWENMQDSYMIPIYANRVGTIELETIKRGEEDTILISEHLIGIYQNPGSSSDSSDGNVMTDDEPKDILDTSDIHAIYSSN